MKRVLSAVAATALLSIAPVTMTGAAHAESGASGSMAAAPASPAAEARKRNLTFYGKERGNTNRFFVAGRVGPNYQNSTVLIKRAAGSNSSNYKPYKTIRTNGRSKYRTGVVAPGRGGTFKYIALVQKRGAYGAARSGRFFQIRSF